MFSEYIELPTYFNLEYSSDILVNFIKRVTIIDNKIDLQYLRKEYIDNNANFISLRDELLLRGCRFIIKRENNLIYNYDFKIKEDSKLIFVEENKDRYKELNTILFKYFDYDLIKDDRYFNFIPIDLVAKANKMDKLELVEKEFTSKGFILKSEEEIKEDLLMSKSGMVEEDDLDKHISGVCREKSLLVDEVFRLVDERRIVEDRMDFYQVFDERLENLCPKIYKTLLVALREEGILTVRDYLEVDYDLLFGLLAGEDKNLVNGFIKYINNYLVETVVKNLSLVDVKNNCDPIINLLNNSGFLKEPFCDCSRSGIEDLKAIKIKNSLGEDQILFNEEIFYRLFEMFGEDDFSLMEDHGIDNIFMYLLNLDLIDWNEKNSFENFLIERLSILYSSYQVKPIELMFDKDEENRDKYFSLEMEKKIDESIEENFNKNRENPLFKSVLKAIDLLDLIQFENGKIDRDIRDLLASNSSLYDYFDLSLNRQISAIRGVGVKLRSNFKFQLYNIYDLTMKALVLYDGEFNRNNRELEKLKSYSDYFLYYIHKFDVSNRTFQAINKELVDILRGDFEDYKSTAFSKILVNEDLDINDYKLDGDNIKKIINSMKRYEDFNKIQDICSDLTNILDQREHDILVNRYLQNMTLNECGDQLDITRERVRQIEKKALTQLNEDLLLSRYIDKLTLFGHKLDEDELKIILKNDLLLSVFKANELNSVFYSGISKMFYFKNLEEIREVTKKIEDYKKELCIYGDFEDLKEDILNIYPKANSVEVDNIILFYRLKVIKGYYYKENISIAFMFEFYLKYLNKKSILISEDTYEDLVEDIESYFGPLSFTKSVRNISAILDRLDGIILVDSRTYQHIDHCGLDEEKIDRLEEIVDEGLEVYDTLTSDRLYGKLLNEGFYELTSKHHAYFLVKYYFLDKYVFSNKNSLTIYKSEEDRKSNIAIIEELLLKYDHPVKINEVIKHTGLSDIRINMTLANNKDSDVIKMYDKVGLASSMLTNVDMDYFENFIDQNMRCGYTTMNYLYNEMLYDEKLYPIIRDNKIENTKELAGLIKYVNNDIKGNSMFLYFQNCGIKSMYDLITVKYPDIVTRREIIKTLEYNLCLDSQSVSLTIKELINDYGYVQISMDEFKNANNILIEEEFERKILELAEKYEDDGFIVPMRLLNENFIETYLTRYTINQYIISYVLEKNGYKKLNRYNMPYTNEILVLVKEEEGYDGIQDLVYRVLKDHYCGKLYEKDVYDYLANLGIYEKKDLESDKRLLQDVLYDGQVQVDWSGRVVL